MTEGRDHSPSADGRDQTTRKTAMPQDSAAQARRRRRWWYLLFLVQLAAIAWPPFYNKAEPSIAGMPFFYWYQLLWIVIGGVLTAIVYFATEKSRRNPGRR